MGETAYWDPDTDTRTKLILAGEALFGSRGIDAVPLHEVVTAAGQRNVSALSYHIGGREALLMAILDYRRSSVDARRFALLQEYIAAGIVMDEAAIAAGIILPLAELMMKDPNGGNYLRLLTQVFVTDRPRASYAVAGRFDQGWRLCRRLYRAWFPGVSHRALIERFETCSHGAMYAMADWERDKVAPRNFPRSGFMTFISDLIALTASALASHGRSDPRFKPFATIQPASVDAEELALQ
ncbi:MAG TPA: hypothetical protein VHB27_24455 [Rhodopila sp.]|uniref:hypothetical protein n=1 Tax=Rhodopila sp. TaxID=2480087 RepID=UPI002D0EAC73|nr:hypothetical protein [Rhodopila sp.]HVY18394.1 hypothetical protein [Rhodopila sp.]